MDDLTLLTYWFALMALIFALAEIRFLRFSATAWENLAERCVEHAHEVLEATEGHQSGGEK